MNETRPSFWEVTFKTTIAHTVTYFVLGLLASVIFDYGTLYSTTQLKFLMRQTTEPLVMAGPLFQPLRGFLFGIVFYLLRGSIFDRTFGWLVLWITLLVIGVFNTFGPTPGSIEGAVYTVVPLAVQLEGLPEVVIQTLLLSLILSWWVGPRRKTWLTWVMGVAFVITILLPILGLVMRGAA